jgi:hypothetical protein
MPLPGDTTVTVDPFAAATGTVCISGTASAVIGEDYGRYWGGGLALNLDFCIENLTALTTP